MNTAFIKYFHYFNVSMKKVMTTNSIDELCIRWSEYKAHLKSEPLLNQLKSFRDHLLCDEVFRKEVAEDAMSVIKKSFPMLGIKDISLFLPKEQRERLGSDVEPSNLAMMLIDALQIDVVQRKQLLAMEPVNDAWRCWRNKQIDRYQMEDKSLRGKQITHIPFAIELTEGCSGECRFCGLSAKSLKPNQESFERIHDIYRDLLFELHRQTGQLGMSGILYWATDPFDHPHYEAFSRVFAEEFGIWPATTTAIGELDIKRLHDLSQSELSNRPWGLRCSLRYPGAYKKIFKSLSARQRACISFIPQYRGGASSYAIAGRAYRPEQSKEQVNNGGTIACMSGLLISLPRRTIELLTPCLAEPNHKEGYRSLIKRKFKSESDIPEVIMEIMKWMPCPAITLETVLAVTIDECQYHLYQSLGLEEVLEFIAKKPITLKELLSNKSKSLSRERLLAYCLDLIQNGVLMPMETF